MAMTFPLTLNGFWNLLPIESCPFDLPEMVQVSRSRGGELMQAEIGTRLWSADVRLGWMLPDEAAEVMPLINLLRGGASFMACDPLRRRPRLDPTGSILGSAAVQINSLAANSRELTLKGLPAGYTLRRNDLLAFSYGTAPVRFALHQIVSASAVASAGGVTPMIEVVPPLRPGATVGAAVALTHPSCKVQMVPRSFQAGAQRAGGLIEGVSFQIMQTLR